MASELKILHVEPGSEIARLLDGAAESPLVLETAGVHYRIVRIDVGDDMWIEYDPEAVRAAVRETTGSWRDIDAEELKAHIYRAREEGSRPSNQT